MSESTRLLNELQEKGGDKREREFHAQLNTLANENQHLKSEIDAAAQTIMQQALRISELEQALESANIELQIMIEERDGVDDE